MRKTFLSLFFAITIFALFLSVALPAAAEEETVNLFNPLRWVNVERPGELVVKAFNGFAAIVGIIAIAFTVFNGFKLVIASNEESITKAKEGLKWSVGGLAVAILSFTVISASAKLLGFAPGEIKLIGEGSDKIANPIRGPAQPGDFVSIAVFVMQNFLGLVGFATVLMIVYYGFRYITAAGNEETLEQAKNGLKWSILGFVVALLAFTIITITREFLLRGP